MVLWCCKISVIGPRTLPDKGVYKLIGRYDPALTSIARVKMGTTIDTDAQLESKCDGVFCQPLIGFSGCDPFKRYKANTRMTGHEVIERQVSARLDRF